MTFQNEKNKSLTRLLIGQALLLISFSVYTTDLLYLLVQEYHESSQVLGIFGALAAIPPAFMAISAPFLKRMRNSKSILILLQVIATMSVLASGLLLLAHYSLISIGIFYFLFSLVTTISESVEIGVIPQIFDQDPEYINRTVDIQYFMSSGLTILSGVVSSMVLTTQNGSFLLLIASFVTAPIGVLFYSLITYDVQRQPPRDTNETYFFEIRECIKKFVHTMPAFLIILYEAILGGISGLLFELMPITMKELGISVALFSVVNSVQKTGDFIGGLVAPFVKWKTLTFFFLDYVVSGSCFIIVTLPITNIARLSLLLISGIVMGMSGNVFEKLMYKSYDTKNISAMHALATSTFSIFSVISYTAAWIHLRTLMLWQITGIMTVVFGLSLLVVVRIHNEW